MENMQSGKKPSRKKGAKALIIISILLIIVLAFGIGAFLFGKIFNISNKQGDTVEKFRKAYTAGIEVPDNATDLRFKTKTLWWAGTCEVAFNLKENEFEDYLDEINAKYVLPDYYTDYGVMGLKVSEARKVKYTKGYNEEINAFEIPTNNLEYLMVDNIDDYEVVYFERETETKIIILASEENGRIYYYISAGG